MSIPVILRRRLRSSASPNFYVDSVNGSDANDGLTDATAFETLGAAAAAASSGDYIALARGSSWRDELALSPLTDVRIGVFGTGNPPIINASDVATGWTQPDAVTYPNVWYIASWTSDCVNSNYPLTLFEDGIEMPNVANIGTCNTTAGSSFITTTPDGDDAIYVHASDSGNPNSNGSVYEASKRVSCIYTATNGATNLTIDGPVEYRNAPWVSGAVVTSQGSTLRRGLVKNGQKHSMFLTSGTVEDFIFRASTPRLDAGGSNFLVFFTTAAGTWPGTVRRVGFLAGDAPDQTTYEDVVTYFSHNDQPGAIHNITAEQIWAVDIRGGGEPRGGTQIVNAPYYKRSGAITAVNSTGLPVVNYGLFNGGADNTLLTSWDRVISLQHCAAYNHKSIRQGDGTRVENCVWWMNGTYSPIDDVGNNLDNLVVNNSVIVTTEWYYAIDLGANTGYTGDYNVFASYFTGRQVRFRYNNTENNSGGDAYKLKWWQDQTGQDANSVYILPADQVAGGANAFWLAWAEAASGTDLTTVGPAMGDFRINPNARVYGGDDTAYIGTFADGTTPITDVGPQFHWHWNSRSLVAGPPTMWPVVPETGAESESYLDDPTGWDFYADVVAPSLSSPTDAANGETAATGSVSTTEGDGTLYWVVSTSATAPTAAQVKAGNDHTGSAAADSGSQSVTAAGVQTLSPAPSGLTASTTYYIHFMHEDAAGNQSSVASGDGFTTDAASGELVVSGWSTDTGWTENSAGNFTATNAAANTEVETTGIITPGNWYEVTITWSGVTTPGSSFRLYLLQFTTALNISEPTDGESGTTTQTIQAPGSGTITAFRALSSNSNGTFQISIVETTAP